jgi:hypothetical protein
MKCLEDRDEEVATAGAAVAVREWAADRVPEGDRAWVPGASVSVLPAAPLFRTSGEFPVCR